MIDYHKLINDTLKQAEIPVYYELAMSSFKTPCISYIELSNIDVATAYSFGYSKVIFQVKVWDNRIANIQQYSKVVDDLIKQIGFTRIGTQELTDPVSGMIVKILTYESGAKYEEIND